MTKRITSIILVTLLVVSLFAFVWCSNTDEMQQKIEDLQQVLQTQTEILTELQNTNAGNATQIANLQTALQEQAKQIEDMQKELLDIFYVARGDNESIDFNLAFEEKNCGFYYADEPYLDNDDPSGNDETYSITKIINSVEELKAYCEEKNNPAFDQQDPKYSMDLSVKIREYTEEYFETKSLIVYYGLHSYSGYLRTIDRISVVKNVLTVHDVIKDKEGLFLMMEHWVCLIEVSKSDIVGVTEATNNTVSVSYELT